jgi:hypothetical protein
MMFGSYWIKTGLRSLPVAHQSTSAEQNVCLSHLICSLKSEDQSSTGGYTSMVLVPYQYLVLRTGTQVVTGTTQVTEGKEGKL